MTWKSYSLTPRLQYSEPRRERNDSGGRRRRIIFLCFLDPPGDVIAVGGVLFMLRGTKIDIICLPETFSAGTRRSGHITGSSSPLRTREGTRSRTIPRREKTSKCNRVTRCRDNCVLSMVCPCVAFLNKMCRTQGDSLAHYHIDRHLGFSSLPA